MPEARTPVNDLDAMKKAYFELLLKKADTADTADTDLLDRIERLVGLEPAPKKGAEDKPPGGSS